MLELLEGLKEIILVGGEKFCQSTTAFFFFLLVIYSHEEIAAGNAHFGVSKLCLSCQYKFVMCSAVLPFPTQNAFGRAQAALVMLSEETLGVLPLITFLLLESPRWGKRGDRWIVVRSFGFCCCCQNKRARVELCKVNMAHQVDSIRCG